MVPAMNILVSRANLMEKSQILKQQLEKENWWKWEMNPICNQMLTYLLNMILSDDSDSSNSSENPSSREPSVDRGLDFSKEKTEFNKIRVPTFTGDCNVDKYDYQGWKEKAVAYLSRVNASVEDKVVALKIAVSGNAGRVLQHAKITKVSQIFKTLKQAYEGFKTSDQLFHIKQ